MKQQEQKQESVKKIPKVLKIIAIIAGTVILYYAVAMTYAYIRIQRGDLVKWGGEWYTKEELAKKVPPQYYEAEAKNTPEEVYATFRQALLDENLELALEQIASHKREEYREAFQDKQKFDEWVKTLPENLTNGEISGNSASYQKDIGDGYWHSIDFGKDVNGYWKINSI